MVVGLKSKASKIYTNHFMQGDRSKRENDGREIEKKCNLPVRLYPLILYQFLVPLRKCILCHVTLQYF
jgi:hypothetical protein